MMKNGASNKVREKCYEKSIVYKVILFSLPAEAINKKCNLRKSIKTYTERKNDIFECKFNSGKVIYIFDEEVCVFIITKECKVYRYGNGEKHFPRNAKPDPLSEGRNCSPNHEVEEDRTKEQRQIADIPVSIKKQTACYKPALPCGYEPAVVEEKIAKKRHWQE